jgi:FMN phosphatase YigB (HAD superfamily)
MNIGIISNINSGIWEAALRDSWVPSVNYKSVILSCKVGVAKPSREIYELAQKESGVNPNEILFIDDKETNLTEPLNMGWTTVLFDPNKTEEGVEKINQLFSNSQGVSIF